MGRADCGDLASMARSGDPVMDRCPDDAAQRQVDAAGVAFRGLSRHDQQDSDFMSQRKVEFAQQAAVRLVDAAAVQIDGSFGRGHSRCELAVPAAVKRDPWSGCRRCGARHRLRVPYDPRQSLDGQGLCFGKHRLGRHGLGRGRWLGGRLGLCFDGRCSPGGTADRCRHARPDRAFFGTKASSRHRLHSPSGFARERLSATE